MSLHDAAQHLASQGRYGDNMLVHMNPKEVAGLQALAEQKGVSLTRNPQTGMPEAFGLGDLNPFRIVQGKGEIGESGFGSMLIGAALMAAGVPPQFAGLMTGGATLAMGGNMRQAFGQGLGAYSGATMAQGAGFAPTQDPNLATVSDAVATPVAPAAAPVAAPVATAPPVDYPGLDAFGGPPPTQAAAQVATATPPPAAAPTAAPTATPTAAPATTTPTISKEVAEVAAKKGAEPSFMSKYGLPLGLGALALTQEEPKGVEVEKQSPGMIRPYIYDPKTGGLTQLRPYKAPGYADGGPVEQMSNANAVGANTGYPQADITGHAYATPWQTPVSQNVVQGTADTGVNRMNGQMLAEGGMAYAGGGVTGSGNLNLNIPLDFGGGQGAANGYQAAGSGGGGTMSGGLDQKPVTASPQGMQSFMQPAQQRAQQSPAQQMLAGLYAGKTAYKQTYEQYLAGRSPLQQDVQLTRQQFENPTPSAAMSNPNYAFAEGGMAYAGGGISHLGDYSDGGRLLKGPGDGVSDSIPAMIGNKQPARLADGEFVIPARIVSELGNGSTNAGARKLYAMMDRIQKARKKTTGKNKVAANPRADKYLPA